MIRDLDRLTARTFGLLVVGGGIYGLTIAYDAAQRGLSVALLERDDFGSGASFHHLRTVHGRARFSSAPKLSPPPPTRSRPRDRTPPPPQRGASPPLPPPPPPPA